MLSILPHRVNKSLTGKLVIAISLFMFMGSFLVWFFAIKEQRKELMEEAISRVISFSEVTQKSIRHDMLYNQMDDIQHVLQSIGESESVICVRIINNHGKVSYSSRADNLEKENAAIFYPCTNCHESTITTPQGLTDKRSWVIHRVDEADYRVLTLLDPIMNAPDCYTAQCHVHSRDQKVLGLLMTDYSLRKIDSNVSKNATSISGSIVVVVIITAIILSLILWRIMLKPFSSLSDAMKQVSAGDLSHKTDISSQDEIGRLAQTFNEMTDELTIARKKMEQWTQSLEEEVEKKTKVIKETQDKLIQAEKMAALGRLTADIAHEIRNPLTVLGGFGRRLQKLATNAKQKQYASLIVTEAGRLENILKDILVFSWEPRVRFERVTLNDTINESIALFTDLFREHNIKVVVQFDTDLKVLIEKEHIRQAIDNLISNAVDAMPRGGTLTITIKEELKNNITYVAIHIADTGTGIPEEEIDHVLEPFYTTKKIGKGTGLGLSIARKIIIEHGGFITVRNRSEGGLTVSLFFPYESDEDMEATPCWEYMKCGRNKDNSSKCPAYPNFGRVCWAVAGTLCAGKIQGTFAQKLEDCNKCEFFQKVQQKTI